MTQKKRRRKESACRDAERNLLVMTQKKSACRDAEKSACRDAGKNLLVVTQKKSAGRDAERNLLVVTKKRHTRAVVLIVVLVRAHCLS